MLRIAPRPVLLIRGMQGNGDEALKGVYRDAGGTTTTLWRSRAPATLTASAPPRPSTSAG